MTQPSRGAAGDLVPGFPDDLCLGFANTRYNRGGDAPTETLADLDAVLVWCRSAALLSAGGEKALRRLWRDDAARSHAFRGALAAPGTVYRPFFSTPRRQRPAPARLHALHERPAPAPRR